MHKFISYFTEQCGSQWRVYQTDDNGPRSFWVQKSNNVESRALPHIYGFYCDTFNSISDLLNN